MKGLCLITLAICLTFCFSGCQGAKGIDYKTSGDNWEGQCSVGHLQSPIDIQTSNVFTDSSLKAYGSVNNLNNATLQYDHHKLLVNYDQGSFTFVDEHGESHWKSLQFHFHSASEHHIDGYEYDVEFHIVFQNKNDPSKLLVTGFFIQGDPNAEPSDFLENLKLNNIEEGEHIRDVKLDGFYSKFDGVKTYNYDGSLTAPPCSENVEWLVISEPLRVPEHQVAQFLKIWPHNHDFAGGHGSDRKIQKLNTRIVKALNFGENLIKINE
jgi:carbonic anhydrase